MGRRFRLVGCAVLAMALGACVAHAAEWRYAKKYTSTRHIKAIDFYDSMNGTFVCNRATVGTTTDGGLTWVQFSLNQILPAQKKNSTFNDVFYLDADNRWIVGENGVMVGTTDGGQVWNRISTPVADVLNSVWFVDVNTGWIAGDGGRIHSTTDGGKTWTTLNTRTNNAMRGLFFKDALNGTAVGDGGTIISTEDGGGRWRDMKSPTPMSLKTVQYIGDRGYVVGGNGAAVVSDDGGKTWEEGVSNVPNSNGMPEPIWSMHFVDSMNGAAAAEFGVVLLTSDGGREWASVDPRPTLSRLNDIEWLDSSTIIAVGEFGTVVRSTDAGKSWTKIWSNPDLFSVEFAKGGAGWAVGTGGTVFHTTDDGVTWEPEEIAVPFQLFGVDAVAARTAFIIGDNRTFFERLDGAWAPIQNPRSETEEEERIDGPGAEAALATYGMDFAPSGQVGWTVGDLAKALRTQDGGHHWVSMTGAVQAAGILNTFYAVDAVDDNTVFAVGAAGTIVFSEDAGETWVVAEATEDIYDELRAVSFAPDGVTGWVVGTGGTILKWPFEDADAEGDEKRKWQPQTNAYTADLNAVYAVSPAEAYAAGAGGTILHTTDGGVTWLKEKSPTGLGYRAITLNSAGVPHAVGAWGIIVAFK
jgi:photosystem II stability/assembly factor-like uncharacterized protein